MSIFIKMVNYKILCSRFGLFIFLFFASTIMYSQNFENAGILFQDRDIKIELLIKKYPNPCGVNPRQNQFSLQMNGVDDNWSRKARYLNWRTDVINCNGYYVTRIFSIDLQNYHAEGINRSTDWIFEANEIIQPFYGTKLSNTPDFTKDFVVGPASSRQPDSISGVSDVISGQQIELSVAGGQLISNDEWVWYENACGKNYIGKGSVLKVAPLVSTTYFVRAEGSGKTGNCVSFTVNVNDNSKPALKIIGRDRICQNNSLPIKLSVLGGKLGRNARWVWYTGACPGLSSKNANWIGEGESISVNPSNTTVYYARAEGATNITSCVEFKVHVIGLSTSPDKILISKNSICEGEQVELEVRGGNLAESSDWVWYVKRKTDTDKQRIGVGKKIVHNSNETCKYYVRAEGVCNSSYELSEDLTVFSSSIPPYSISVVESNSNKFRYNLTLNGGKLGEKAKWKWYYDLNGKELAGTGQQIEIKTKKSINIHVRAEGKCNNTQFVSRFISPPQALIKASRNFIFFNAGVVAFEVPKDNINAQVTIGSKKFYLRAKFNYKVQGNNQNVVPQYICDNQTILDFPYNNSYFIFTGQTIQKRTAYTIGTMIGGNVIRIYLGAGYGKNDVLWQSQSFNSNNASTGTFWAKNIQQSFSGPEGEGGIFLKLGFFNIMAGINAIYSIETKEIFRDATLGVGFSF